MQTSCSLTLVSDKDGDMEHHQNGITLNGIAPYFHLLHYKMRTVVFSPFCYGFCPISLPQIFESSVIQMVFLFKIQDLFQPVFTIASDKSFHLPKYIVTMLPLSSNDISYQRLQKIIYRLL